MLFKLNYACPWNIILCRQRIWYSETSAEIIIYDHLIVTDNNNMYSWYWNCGVYAMYLQPYIQIYE